VPSNSITQIYSIKVEELIEATDKQICIIESVIVLKMGTELLSTKDKNSKELNFEDMDYIIDMIKSSIIYARQRDLEQEAKATIKLGDIYFQYLLMKKKALTYYMTAI